MREGIQVVQKLYPSLLPPAKHRNLLTFKRPSPTPHNIPTHHSTMAQALASKRLFHEYKNLSQSPPEGITAGPVSEDDLFTWEALIQGPEGTPYEGGIFPAELKFPKDYPLSPPKMKFEGELWHPNGMPQPSPPLPSFPHLTLIPHLC